MDPSPSSDARGEEGNGRRNGQGNGKRNGEESGRRNEEDSGLKHQEETGRRNGGNEEGNGRKNGEGNGWKNGEGNGRRNSRDNGRRPSQEVRASQEVMATDGGPKEEVMQAGTPSSDPSLRVADPSGNVISNQTSGAVPIAEQLHEDASARRQARAVEKRESITRRTSLVIDKTPASPGPKAPASPGPKAPASPGPRRDFPPSTSLPENSDGEYAGRPARRQWGNAIRNLSKDSSEADSMVDEIEATYIRDVMKKRRTIKESQVNDAMGRGILGDTGVPEFHARLMALRLAVQEHELPMKLAYEELDELAANAERVRSAVEKNITLLTLQIRRSNLRYMRSAFTAWALHTEKKRARRLAMKNAAEYFLRRMWARAFQAWRIFLLRMQKFKRLQQSAEKFLRRHNLARIWRAWGSLVKRRLREDERHRREKQLVRDLQERQRECVGRRAVNAIRRRRLRRAFFAFKIGVQIRRDIQARYDHIFYIMIRRKAAKAFTFWERYPKKRERDTRAIQRGQRKILLKCFWHWEDETAFTKYRKRRMNKCRLGNAFRRWICYVTQKARHDTIVARVTRAHLRRHLTDLREGCLEEKWRKRNCKRARKKCDLVKLRWFFQAWICYMQIQAHKRMLRLEDYVALLEKENQRTRSECDRLGRIVDSGEWDQQRVMELEQASQILSGERDALTKLVGRLEREHTMAMENQNQQEMEIRRLKDQILGSNFMHRNKLLVRGASSFNSVVRAVKSEVLKKGVNPEVVYSIDNMAMDQVSVFPDGDLRVKSLNKFDKGKWMHKSVSDSTKAFMEDPANGTRGVPTFQSPRRSIVRDHSEVR